MLKYTVRNLRAIKNNFTNNINDDDELIVTNEEKQLIVEALTIAIINKSAADRRKK